MANARFRCPTRSTGAVQTRYATHGIADDEATRWQHAACETPCRPARNVRVPLLYQLMQQINGALGIQPTTVVTARYHAMIVQQCSCALAAGRSCARRGTRQHSWAITSRRRRSKYASYIVHRRGRRHARTHARTQGGTDAQGGTGRPSCTPQNRNGALARAQVHPSHIPLLIGRNGAVIMALRDALNVQVSA